MVRDEPDAAAASAVASIGATLGDVCLSSKRDTTSAAIAATDIDVALVNEIAHGKTLHPKGLFGLTTPERFPKRGKCD